VRIEPVDVARGTFSAPANVETASKGDMKFIISGPETVPTFEQLQPVRSGVFQLLLPHGAYHIGQTPYLLAVEARWGVI
jgi:hypothetical protein